MADRREQERFLSASECAARMGMSIRALRLYEKRGLINPRRSKNQWRLYGLPELARLHEIQMLKRFGLRLSDMAKIFDQQATDIGRTLAVQEDLLTDQLSQAEQGLMLIGTLRRRHETGDELSTCDLLTLAKEMKMPKPTTEAIAWRRYEQMRPRTSVHIDSSVLEDYIGAFRFDDGTYYFVTLNASRLFTRVAGQPDLEIVPESETAFFMRDLPVQVTFLRGADQRVNELVHHQHGLEMKATRTDEKSALAAEAAIANRVKESNPDPNSGAILRRIISDLQAGRPDFTTMTPTMAEVTRAQLLSIQARLAGAASLVDLEFKGVGAGGWDIFEAEHAHARLEWRIVLSPSGTVSGLLLRDLP